MVKMWKLSQTDVTVGTDRQCLILWHVMMPPIAPWTDLAMPNTGRNLPNSIYRGLDEEDYSLYRGIFAVLSLRYGCLLYSNALFINTNRPHLLHDLLVSGLRHVERDSQAQHTVQSMRLHNASCTLARRLFVSTLLSCILDQGRLEGHQRWTNCLGWLFHCLACHLFPTL